MCVCVVLCCVMCASIFVCHLDEMEKFIRCLMAMPVVLVVSVCVNYAVHQVERNIEIVTLIGFRWELTVHILYNFVSLFLLLLLLVLHPVRPIRFVTFFRPVYRHISLSLSQHHFDSIFFLSNSSLLYTISSIDSSERTKSFDNFISIYSLQPRINLCHHAITL